MSNLSEDLVFLVLKYLDEEGYKEAAHMLERESGLYFDMNYFEELVLSGKWDEAEKYLTGFTKLDDNKYSTKIYFEIRKQHYFEALDKKCLAEALDVLTNDLQVFAKGNEELFKEMTQLMTFENIREHESLSMYRDTKSARKVMMKEIRRVIEANPIFRGRLEFPIVKGERLRRLINQSLNWQHMQCEDPHPNPAIDTLFIDHVCDPQVCIQHSPSIENNAKPSRTTSYQSPTCSVKSSLSTIAQYASCIGGSFPANNPATEVIEDSDVLSKRMPIVTGDEVTSTITDHGQNQISELAISKNLPSTVVRTLDEGSSPVSMDFHPVWLTVLLVGTSAGEIGLWDISCGGKMVARNFNVWDLGACSMALKVALEKDSHVSVNRVLWSPDGFLFGVAYSKHVVQLYSYIGGDELDQILEIDAHLGGVNDLAFSSPEGELLVITCGDDRTIKVWDVVSGNRCFTFEGHDAPVYSICPHIKDNIPFIFSVSTVGRIKVWLYDNLGDRIDYDAPGLGCTKMAYSADERLFSCGTSKGGESYLVEWNDTVGCFKRVYKGLGPNPLSAVQFDITSNQLLAAGDDHMVKFWHMDNTQLLNTIDADGGLPANPHIRFNSDGSLLAVSSSGNQIKILANANGLDLLQGCGNDSIDASGVESETSRKNGNVAEVNSKTTGEATYGEKAWETIERPSQCQSLQLCADVKRTKISKLIYTNAGDAILALTSNAIHLLWKWPQNDLSSSGKATTKVQPLLWRPTSGLQLMSNDLSSTNPEEAMPCFALSKNDSYLMSASGGMISLFNVISFKTMRKVMAPPPAATCLAFDPRDNNVVVIGMDDSTIMIYNARLDKVTKTLAGHTKRVTSLAFSTSMKSLVSSGADAQIFVWNADEWKIQRSQVLQIPDWNKLRALSDSDTHVQFHEDQLHFLIVHKTHLAIYEVKELGCVNEWVSDSSVPISHATFSCDSQTVYASFVDGTIGIFDASVLVLCCLIKPSAYLPTDISYTVYPVVIAGHPQKPTQFAVGLSNGEVHVLEPLESEGKWGILPTVKRTLKSSAPAKSTFRGFLYE
ncbi:topless-related protein 1 isoform X2 [Rosa chinensis]|uniref:topless-related protein 1 isoform X2 n=1 Tax=Rosa chinensis TaxID=74649 RepID=UPI000D087FA1|nr:topless-related protein 1 isoform X2 [Rosa chinensis]